MDEQAVIEALARTVRAARKQRGWSQDQLSAHAGISKGALVALERAETNPNLSTLCRLGDALDLNAAQLLEQRPANGLRIVDAAGVAPLWRGPAGGTAAVVLVTGGAAPVELWRWRLPAGEFYENVPYPDGAGVVKTVTVVTGALRLTLDGAGHDLRRGATATFDGSAAHAFRGSGRGGCELLVTTHLPPGSNLEGPDRWTS